MGPGSGTGLAIVLAADPADMDVIELAVTLAHEARHHHVDAYGRRWTIDHRCADCSDLWQRALDPIYQADEPLRARLLAALQPRPTLGDVVGGIAAGVAVGAAAALVFWAGAELVRAIARPRYA
jgi:hypothetical protein